MANQAHCRHCSTISNNARLPRGWKRHQGQVYCTKCWSQKFALRAVVFPVVSPLDRSWADLNEVLRRHWKMCTALINWMVTQLYIRDVRRNGEEKMPPMPRVYLYPEARALYPDLAPQTVVSIEHQVQRKYRALRYKLVWTNQISLPNCRYPAPLPIHNQSWKAEWAQHAPVVRFRLGGEWVCLRLKGGPRFRRQLRAFKLITSGEAVRGEMAIYRRGYGRPATYMKLVAWLPKPPQKQRTGVLRVRTSPDALIVSVNDKDEILWRYNARHVKRWTAEHASRLQQWAEDSKFESRPAPSFSARRHRAKEKFRNRISSACHEAAAALVGYAHRRKFATIEYDDQDQTYLPSFAWHKLRALIQEKTEYYDIDFVHASTPVSSGSLAEEIKS